MIQRTRQRVRRCPWSECRPPRNGARIPPTPRSTAADRVWRLILWMYAKKPATKVVAISNASEMKTLMHQEYIRFSARTADHIPQVTKAQESLALCGVRTIPFRHERTVGRRRTKVAPVHKTKYL